MKKLLNYRIKNSVKIENLKLKVFITEFNFPDPSWDNLPVGFPYCDLIGLTKEEKHLFDAIVTAWIVQQPVSYFVKKLIFPTLTLASIFALVAEILSFAYWVNIEYNLGLKFLTDFFA